MEINETQIEEAKQRYPQWWQIFDDICFVTSNKSGILKGDALRNGIKKIVPHVSRVQICKMMDKLEAKEGIKFNFGVFCWFGEACVAGDITKHALFADIDQEEFKK